MNFYGTEKYFNELKSLNESVFSKIDLSESDRTKELCNGYLIKYFYYANVEHCVSGHAPTDGEICRLYYKGVLIYEWKNIYGRSHLASIIQHSDGNDYFIFDEDLYGYSVLNLTTLESMHYIPAESHNGFQETFIWCDCIYNSKTNQLAVGGCYWAGPYEAIVLDFSKPMISVEPENWIDLFTAYIESHEDIDDIDPVRWEDKKLICKCVGTKPKPMCFTDSIEVVFE